MNTNLLDAKMSENFEEDGYDKENCIPNIQEKVFKQLELKHSKLEKKQPIFRICFTGGPCAGKTTAIAKLQTLIDKLGFRVFTVPEAATLLMKSGAMINANKMTQA